MRGLLQGGLALASLIVGAVLLLKPPTPLVEPTVTSFGLEISPETPEETLSETEEAAPLQSQQELEPLPEGVLTDDYIQQTLGRQSRFLRSCFLKYFERTEGQTQVGVTVLNIHIEATGRVRAAKIIRSEIEDEGFRSCLQSVVLRTRFRPFNGPPLHVEYPIDLVAN